MFFSLHHQVITSFIMKVNFKIKEKKYTAELNQPIDISMVLKNGLDVVNCFHAPYFEASPLVAGDFVGDTREGSPVNFYNVRLNPHGNGTHTECVGHIAKERYYINDSLQHFHHAATLISVYPTKMDNGDKIISLRNIQLAVDKVDTAALIIRTLPNDNLKKKTNYSGANPTYMDVEAMKWIVEQGVEHLLVDLPSVDREEDAGALVAHHAFWKYPENIRKNATITELIFVPNTVKDGLYLLNLSFASFQLDASPSKPILYVVEEA